MAGLHKIAEDNILTPYEHRDEEDYLQEGNDDNNDVESHDIVKPNPPQGSSTLLNCLLLIFVISNNSRQ